YSERGIPVEFVGHPLIDLVKPSASREAFLRDLGMTVSAPTIALLPGSRPNEVERILPDLVAAAEQIRERLPDAQFIVARAPNLDDRLFSAVQQSSRPRNGALRFAVVEG